LHGHEGALAVFFADFLELSNEGVIIFPIGEGEPDVGTAQDDDLYPPSEL
jgi:hypothetical protein